MTRRTAALTPSVLAMIGRALARHGEIVFDLEVSGGRLRMLPASASYVTVGNGDPRTWIYTVTVDGPDNTMTHYRGRDGVAHLQYAVDPVRPWLGRAPWAVAGLSGTLLAGIERQLSGEAGSASGYILPTPDVGDRGQEGENADEEDDPLTTLHRDLAAAGGRTLIGHLAGGAVGQALLSKVFDAAGYRIEFDTPDGYRWRYDAKPAAATPVRRAPAQTPQPAQNRDGLSR